MRRFKARQKRRLLELSLPSSPVQNNNSDLSENRRVIWIPNDSNDPKSPISIECLPQKIRRRFSKVKTRSNVALRMNRNKNHDSNSAYPFFIDKTPTPRQERRVFKKRRLDMNDSVVILDSPSTSTSAPVESDGIIFPQTRDSVDTVDLCSESEDEIETPKVDYGKKRKRIELTQTNLNESVLDVSSPDIIVLDEEDVPKKEKEKTSVVVKSTSDPLVSSISLSNEEKNTNSADPDSTSFLGFSLNSPNLLGTSSSLNSLSQSNVPVFPNKFAKSCPSTSSGPSFTSVPNKSNSFNFNPSDTIPTIPNSGSSSNGPSDKVSSEDLSKSIPSNVGSNVFNPNCNVEQTGLRPIIIDGCNVAIAHGVDRMFSVRGLCICVEYFLRRGHTQVLALVPLHQRCKVSRHDREILDCLQKDKHLVFTPSRYIDKKLISSYDDRFIVQYAAAVGGVIVSRDNYRDLLDENPAWKETILKRLLMPTWVGDMLMFPVDPLGKKGPNLDEFLCFPKK